MKILITGGTSGIGKSLVTVLAKEHEVAFIGRNKEAGEKLAQQTDAMFLKADLTNEKEVISAIEKFYESFGHCDVLVNNAGLWTEGSIETANSEEVEKVFAINTISPVIVTSEIVKRIINSITAGQQDGARIIFTNSQAGLAPKALRSVYNASKWAITGFARSLSLELAESNIGITNLCPGYVGTELFDNAGYPRETTGSMKPEDVASAVQYIIGLPFEVSVNELAIKPTQYS